MTPKGLTSLAAVTILVALGAAWALQRDAAGSRPSGDDGPLLPGLVERVNDVARIEVETAADQFAVRLADGTWGLEGKGGYPVEFASVKALAVGLANLEVLQPKTRNPEYFGKLGLTDPETEGSRAKRVTLEDASGTVLASVLVGDTKWSGSDQTVYVRRAGEDQSFHCSGRIDLPAKPLDWVDRKILQLDRKRLRSATLTRPDGEELTFERESADETTWPLLQVPADRELSSPSAGSSVATWLTYLSLDDVRPVGEVDFAADPGPVLETSTFDGLVVRAVTTRADDKTWVRLEASYEPPPESVGPAPAEEEEGDGDEGSDAGTPEGAEDEGPDEEAVRAEAEELDGRLSGWAFALQPYKADQLSKGLEDFLAPLPEPEEPADAPGSEADPAAAEEPAAEAAGGL